MKRAFFAMSFLAAALSPRAEDTAAYTVPKEHPMMAAAPVAVAGREIHWKTPAAWTELAPTTMRIGNFRLPDGAEVAITSFPGRVGTELDNVNRWRREVGLESIGAEAVASEAVRIAGLPGKLYDLTGASSATAVASLPRNGAMWFIKLRGPKQAVAAARPTFLAFLQTIQFGAVETADAAVVPTTPPLARPEPKWEIPANWVETPAGMMLRKKFSVANSGGEKASVSISAFPGAVGGVLANVNRWRAQLGLTPVSGAELPGVAQSLPALGGQATVVDFSSKDSSTDHPARMVAVMVAKGDETWFYKLAGSDAVVTQEKAAFLKLALNARYHD